MKIGVTGSYASGKGTVCKMFEELGAVNIDTDIIAREIVEPQKEAYLQIVQTFGKEYLSEDGNIDRAKLAELVFNNKDSLTKLNNITHPLILEEVLKLSSDNNRIHVVNTPLLFESGYNKYMDKNVTVKSSDSLSVIRGKLRDGISEENIKNRLKNQFSLKEKLKFSDYIIDNTGSLKNTREQVEELWKILIKLNQSISRK